MAPTSRFPALPGRPETRAWIAWAAFAVAISVILVLGVKPSHVTKTYFPTAETWWQAEQDVYTPGIKGFLYLPQSLYLFSPFLVLPEGPVREITWRLFGLLLFAFGLRRVLRRVAPDPDGRHFEAATLLVVLATAASARNGQTNLHLTGLMMHSAADLIDRRFVRASALLWLGMLAKPVAAVPLLLVGALVGPTRKPLAIGLVLFALLPFLHHDMAYASEQYRLAFEKLARSGQPGAKPYDNLVGLVRNLGYEMPQALRLALSIAAALGTLALGWVGLRRGGRAQGPWLLMAFAAAYLMLFNPRTEVNSYVILVPWMAMAAAATVGDPRRRRVALLLIVGCLAFGADSFGRTVHEATRGVLRPAMALAFLTWLAFALRNLRDHPVLPAVLPDDPASSA